MSRKETYYFAHDYGARNDPKLQDVLIDLGVAGIGVFWCIIEQLYEQGGTLPIRSCKSIAFALHVDCNVVERLVHDYELFKNDGQNMWSESVLNRLNRRTETSEKRKAAALARWRQNIENQSQTQVSENAKAMQKQCKSNANAMHKENKIKENNNKEEEEEEEEEENDFADVVIGDEVWVEVTAMQSHLSRDDVISRLADFRKHCIAQGHGKHRNIVDFKSHFVNWLRIKLKDERNNNGARRYFDATASPEEYTDQW